jgi:hypothetical protein
MPKSSPATIELARISTNAPWTKSFMKSVVPQQERTPGSGDRLKEAAAAWLCMAIRKG